MKHDPEAIRNGTRSSSQGKHAAFGAGRVPDSDPIMKGGLCSHRLRITGRDVTSAFLYYSKHVPCI